MGVSGVGKTTIGKLLASKLKLPFYDADDYHPDENVLKMSKGMALDDSDRKAWLEILVQHIKTWNESSGAVLACSALKGKYREVLSTNLENEVVFIYLYADYQVIYERMLKRKNHYFKPELLKSQFDTLEAPKKAIKVNVDHEIPQIIDEILSKVGGS